MANIARDGIDVIRISRKAILTEVLKELGVSKAQFTSSFEDGRYLCTAITSMPKAEPETSAKKEEGTDGFYNTKEDAEESAAVALMDVLKRVYKVEIDDMNFIGRARNKHCKEQLEKEIQVLVKRKAEESEKVKKLKRGLNQLLDDISFVQEPCEDVCGNALACLPEDYKTEPQTDIIRTLVCLNGWTEQKIFEHTSNREELGDLEK